VGNALKFTEEGEVSIKVEAGQVDLNADHRSVELHFMVSDTGIGISEEVFKEIPIIALTARQAEAEIRKCIDAGCAAFVGKPIQRQLLIDMIIPYLEATTVSEPVRQV
jgi:CheY-like chemotaxis protein